MPVLTSQQRGTLETAVKQARKLAETGARNALHSLAVDHPEPFSHMSPDQRALRNRLRHKARLLGDDLPSTGNQQIDRLGYELAYENWHKMLFAKFLESNGLLMHPSGVAIMMEECEELAREEGFIDKWDAAAAYASKMLPAIFRTDDPLMQIQFAADDRIKLEAIIDALDSYIFTADDALGWVYQFWQSDAKASINASGDKIDGAKLPAVTQLFTEPYMVHFLIDNTLGAWWISRNPGVTAPVKFEYLRLLEDGTPAAGKFEGWPNKTSEVTSLDPCMGSGHFVASLFPVFATLRMYEEGLTKEEATDKVITENLHGLELDPRCTQIAAFNLALTAWKFCGHYKELPEMNLACSGIAPKGKVEDWVKLVDKIADPVDKSRMENGMRMLYDHFQLAPELGSLLDPTTMRADAFTASFEQLQPVLAKALEGEADKDMVERGVMAAGIAKAGEILAQKYTLLITNVPYLGNTRLVEKGIISNYGLKYYPEAKADLANVFLERMLKSNFIGGISCTVMPQNWLFLSTYRKFREKVLKNETWHFVARLGAGAFSQITGEVVKAILVSISRQNPSKEQPFFGLDVSEKLTVFTKDKALKNSELKLIDQSEQLMNPSAALNLSTAHPLNEIRLNNLIDFHKGICSGDRNRFIRNFFEVQILKEWQAFRSSSIHPDNPFSGVTEIFYWQNGEGDFIEFLHQRLGESIGAWLRGESAWNRRGITVSRVSTKNVIIYNGELFDDNISVFTPKKTKDIAALYSFVKSDEFYEKIKAINQKLSIDNEYFSRVSIDLDKWLEVSNRLFPNGLPKIYIDFPDEFYFHGHPINAENPLQVAVARLLGYRWPAESDTEMELADEARELIKAVKAFDHLTDEDGIFCIPSVNAEEAGADRLRSYLQEVFGGEYTNQTISELLTKVQAASSGLEDYLRKEFFSQHCKLFQNRPFIWNIWDGRSDGFSALVNYHMLTKENLNKLIYTYLGDWIRMCDAKMKSGESGAEGLLSAALKLKEKLEAILQGEAPYDIFVRWKPLSQQPIGWDPDLNDGVRLNIRPFVEAGVLRSKFNIKWGVDRGKNPPGSHWGEVRDNDMHLSSEEKREARANL